MSRRDERLIRRLRHAIGTRYTDVAYVARAGAIIDRIKRRYTAQWEHEASQRLLARIEREG